MGASASRLVNGGPRGTDARPEQSSEVGAHAHGAALQAGLSQNRGPCLRMLCVDALFVAVSRSPRIRNFGRDRRG
jgi:hypothetical protein